MNAFSNIESRAGLLWFGNTLVAIPVSAGDGADGLCVVEHWAPYGESPPLHIHHTEDEVFVVLEGGLRLSVGGRIVHAEAGDRLLAPKGVPHSFRVESAEGARFLTLTRGRDFETMVRKTSRPAAAAVLPEPAEPSPGAIAALTRACAESRIEIVGAPLS